MSFKLLKDQRLRYPAEIRHCFNHNKRLNGRFFTVFWSDSQSAARFCAVVSKKTSKHAVRRNLIRRIVREDFRCFNRATLYGDLVILARRSSGSADRRELRICINTLLKKVAKFQEKS